MATTKLPKVRIRFEEERVDETEREERRRELLEHYPGGAAWIQPICTYREETGLQKPRKDDHWVPLCTHLKIPVSVRKGTHPLTQLPRVEDRYVTINLLDPVIGIPVDVRTDTIPGLGSRVIDPLELLEFLEDYPVFNIHFRLLPLDPNLEKKVKAALRSKEAKARMRDASKDRSRPSLEQKEEVAVAHEAKTFDEAFAEEEMA